MKRAAVLLVFLTLAATPVGSAAVWTPNDEELREAVAQTLMLSRIANGTYEWSETKSPAATGLFNNGS